MLSGLVALGACGGAPPAAPPTPQPTVAPSSGSAPHPGASSGPTKIAFVESTPAPGATISGCGSDATGCAGRLQVTVRLTPSGSGTALYVAAFLHASNMRACLLARTGPLILRAGEGLPVILLFDQADACAVPTDITHLAVVVEGTTEVASRQEWGVAYRLMP
jgi:hypothetical protein